MNAGMLSRLAARALAVRAAPMGARAASSIPRGATRPASAAATAAAAAATATAAAAAAATTSATSATTTSQSLLRRAGAAAAGAAGLAALTASIASASADPAAAVTKEDIAGATAALQDLLDRDENEDLGPTLVRLAWHASGTYDKETGTGGSEGATMRFSPESSHDANAGLSIARTALEPIKKLFPQLTYSDLWTLAGAVAIEHMGGPPIVWRPGRRDAVDGSACTPDGRLPDADKGKVGETIRHVRDIFTRQGFSDREIVALVGAHTLGRCHTDRSGYTGPWTRAPTTFSNLYFKELIENTWTLKQWDGPDQFEDPTGDLMMLPADMALLWDKDFRKYVVEFAKDEEVFFSAFASAFRKLEENGVAAFAGARGGKPWYQFW